MQFAPLNAKVSTCAQVVALARPRDCPAHRGLRLTFTADDLLQRRCEQCRDRCLALGRHHLQLPEQRPRQRDCDVPCLHEKRCSTRTRVAGTAGLEKRRPVKQPLAVIANMLEIYYTFRLCQDLFRISGERSLASIWSTAFGATISDPAGSMTACRSRSGAAAFSSSGGTAFVTLTTPARSRTWRSCVRSFAMPSRPTCPGGGCPGPRGWRSRRR